MQRNVFNEDHEAFRKTIRDFIAKEVVPVHHEWEKQGHPPRDFYRKLGELGVLGIEVPEEVLAQLGVGVDHRASPTARTQRRQCHRETGDEPSGCSPPVHKGASWCISWRHPP